MRRLPLVPFLACLLLSLPVRAHAPATVPDWVVALDVPSPSPGADDDTEALLDDTQVRVESDHALTFVHRAFVVRSAAGMQSSSELKVGRASDDVISWHFLRRSRGGQRDELLPGVEIKVIQPEAELAEGIYDGSKQEVVFIQDVRVGDVIEYAYSVRSSNAVLGNRHADFYWLGRWHPVRKLELRVWWPEDRTMAVRATHASVERPSQHELRFTRDDSPAYQKEAHEPPWFDATPRVEVSEFAGWSDVVAWALPHYALVVPPEVAAKAATFASGTRAEQLERAVRFVQDEVRYLGLEEGIRALIPHPPAEVLARRFGDCKDKAVLLVSLLRALGFTADTALVNTDWQQGIAQMQPSAVAFNHVIVRTELGGKELWFDATGSYERGPIDAPHALPHARALVLRAGETDLRKLALTPSAEPDVEVHERFELPGAEAATLEVRTTHRGAHADAMRGSIAHTNRGDLQKNLLDAYAARYGAAHVRAPLEVKDDPRHNVLVVTEHYTLDEFWQDDGQTVMAWSLADYLPLPQASRAERPLALPHPLRARHIIELDGASAFSAGVEDVSVDAKEFKYEVSVAPDGFGQTLTHDFVSRADFVPAAGVDAYRREATRALAHLGCHYATGGRSVDPQSKMLAYGMLALLGGGLGLWGLWVAARRLRLWQRRRRVTTKQRPLAGEAPDSAIEVSDLASARLLLLRVECCEAQIFAGELVPSRVQHKDDQLALYRGVCVHCNRVQARYFRVQSRAGARTAS